MKKRKKELPVASLEFKTERKAETLFKWPNEQLEKTNIRNTIKEERIFFCFFGEKKQKKREIETKRKKREKKEREERKKRDKTKRNYWKNENVLEISHEEKRRKKEQQKTQRKQKKIPW